MINSVKFEVAKGKWLEILRNARGEVYMQYIPGGAMPECLSGTYTSMDKAIQDATVYLASKGKSPLEE
jgi:hypothetical protein